MPIPAIGAAAKSVLTAAARKSARTLLVESVGEKKAVDTLREIKTAQQRARRAEARLTQALEFATNPQAAVTKSAKKLARELTRSQLESGITRLQEIRAGLRAGSEGYSKRVIQRAQSENRIASVLRAEKLGISEEFFYREVIEGSEAVSKSLWAYVTKENQRSGITGRRSTVADIKRIGGSNDLQTAVNNIFTEQFGVTIEDAMGYDGINLGPDDFYKLNQYSIASGNARDAAQYQKASESGWYEKPKRTRRKRKIKK